MVKENLSGKPIQYKPDKIICLLTNEKKKHSMVNVNFPIGIGSTWDTAEAHYERRRQGEKYGFK